MIERRDTIRVHRMPLGPFQTNCFLVEDVATKDALVVDPGGEIGRAHV